MDTAKRNVLWERRNRKESSAAKSSLRVFTQPGSLADMDGRPADVRYPPGSGHSSARSAYRLCADIVARVFLGWRTKILRAADALDARRCGGPYRFIQNRSPTFVVALKGDAAADKSRNRLSRDF